ncbi:MAG: Ubiquinone biosynthesis O-methyltransferase [Syntrophaceae bacterium PtaU1.Bin231]|nr:MAG: Ubiquinone biosynthesis O-methyltransferase [Syntrophaceae bacterium PtaU1.Bin231]
MKTVQACPYCGEPESLPAGPDGKFFRCRRCDLIGRTSRREEILQYYEEHYFDEHAQDQLSGERSGIYEHILDRMGPVSGNGRLLDVGCGCGFFLQAAMRRGWRVAGIDPSAESIRFARSLVGDVVTQATLEGFSSPGRFTAATLINVLDHFVHPWSEMRRVRDLLEPGGFVFIRVPNGWLHLGLLNWMSLLGAEKLASRWLVFHEYCLSPAFLRNMLFDLGFHDIQIRNARMSEASGTNRGAASLILHGLIYIAAKGASLFTRGRVLLSPSLEITARKRSGPSNHE